MDKKEESIKKLKEEFFKLKQKVKELLNVIKTAKQTHLQNYLYFAHHPVFSFTESIIILCDNGKSRVAEVLLRTLFEVHIDIIYHQLGNSEERLALSTRQVFDERIIILKEISALIKKYPNFESSEPNDLFNKSNLANIIDDQELHKKAILKGNPRLEGRKKLHVYEKAKLCDDGQVKNAEKGNFDRMYSLIYRQLSPVSHLNIEGLQEFIGQDKYGKLFFYDGNDGNFIIREAISICLAFTKDLYDNEILKDKPIQAIEEMEKLISNIGSNFVH